MKKFLSVLCACCLTMVMWASELVLPSPMVPARLVNDFAHIFNAQEQQALEYPLRQFYDSTSTQIAVVSVPNLQGYEINEYATRLFNEWGIGGSTKDNGVLILLVPKTAYQDGQVFIATGYGAEGVLPDAICYDLVEHEMIPYFREGSYFGGVRAAINQIIPILSGEFTSEDYYKELEKEELKSTIFDIVIVVAFLVILFISYRRNNRGGNSNDPNASGGSSSGGPFVGGYWGPWGGSSGGGSFGGGFGGFGGGSSGGGGAGGRW